MKHTRVADLTVSEKQRLNVACHLLLDTDIVLLDQPTQGMDIFDTFFLGMVRWGGLDMVWCSMVWYGMVWYGMEKKL